MIARLEKKGETPYGQNSYARSRMKNKQTGWRLGLAELQGSAKRSRNALLETFHNLWGPSV